MCHTRTAARWSRQRLSPTGVRIPCGGIVLMNRRLPTPDGIRLAPNPAGPVDHDVPVLQISAPDNRLLAVALESVPLPFAPLPAAAELRARAASPNGFVARHAQMILQNWPDPGDQPPDYQYPVQVSRLGDQQPVWVAGYSNLVNACIPNHRTLQEGGYEGTEAIIYQSLPAPFRPELEDRIKATVQRLSGITRQ